MASTAARGAPREAADAHEPDALGAQERLRPPGHRPLQQTLADHMRERGSTIEADNILVTNGAQQAIELVFHTYLERGDSVIIEEPTYTGALSVLGSIGARAVAVPVDDQGMREDLAAIALERHRPRLMYLQPTFQTPTTAVIGEERRRRLLEHRRRRRRASGGRRHPRPGRSG